MLRSSGPRAACGMAARALTRRGASRDRAVALLRGKRLDGLRRSFIYQADEIRPFRVTPALPVGPVAQLPLRQPIREVLGRCAGDGILKRACWRSSISKSE